MLEVALLTDADRFAGTESHMLDLARGLCDEGVRARIACPAASPLAERATVDGIPILPIEKHGLVDREAIRVLRRLLKSGEIQIVHAHNGRTALSAALAVQFAGRGACVLTQHFLEPDHASRKGFKAQIYQAAHRWVNGRAAQIIAISEAARAGMLARKEVTPSKTAIVPNGIATPDLDALVSRGTIRSELKVALDAPLIVCVARLEREKDIASLIAAMPAVIAAHPSAVCAVVGDGTQEIALKAQVQRLRLNQAVRMLGYRNDPLSIVLAGDLFVLPSLAEPFGLVLLEAMALGKPVIATHAGGPREIVRPGETGMLVPPATPAALAEAICSLIATPATAMRMGEAGQARFLGCYTRERMAKATAALYKQAVNG